MMHIVVQQDVGPKMPGLDISQTLKTDCSVVMFIIFLLTSQTTKSTTTIKGCKGELNSFSSLTFFPKDGFRLMVLTDINSIRQSSQSI